MQKLTKKLSLVMVALMTVFTALSYMPAKAATVTPKLQMVAQPTTEYKVGDRITLKVTSPNYPGKVEYRVICYNGTTKTTSELWQTPSTGYYYKGWQPAGNFQFPITWVVTNNMQPGAYSLTVLVRRVGAKVAYDSHIDTKGFWVKAATATVESIAPVTEVTVNEGAKAVLPETVTLNMSDKTTKTAKVTWAAVDTTKVGTFAVEGTVEGTDKKASVNVVVKEVKPEVSSASVVAANKMKVVFNKAVDTTKVTFEIKNSSFLVPVTVEAWNEAKTEVTLKKTYSNFTSGDYTVAAKGLEFAEGKNAVAAKVEDERIEKIEFVSPNLVKTGTTTATIEYKVYNQYNEDITSTSLVSGVSSFGTVAPVKGTATVTKANAGTWASTDTVGTVTLYTATKNVTATVNVLEAKALSSLTLGSVVLPKDTTRLVPALAGVKVNYTAIDQYGNAVTLTNLTGITFVPNPNVSSVYIGTDPEDATKKALLVDLNAVAVKTTITLTAIVNNTGKSSSTNFDVYPVADIVDFTLTPDTAMIKAGTAYKVWIDAVDTYGNAIKATDLANADVKFSIVTLNNAIAAADTDIKYDATAKKAYIAIDPKTADKATNMVVTLVANGKNQTLPIAVSKASEIVGMSLSANSLNFADGGSATLKASFIDQYGEAVKTLAGYTVKYTSDTVAVVKSLADATIAQAVTGVAVAPEASQSGKTAQLTVALLKGVTEIDSQVVTVKVIDSAKTTLTYSIADIAKLNGLGAYNAASDYAATLELTAKDASGNTIYVPNSVITAVTSTNSALVDVQKQVDGSYVACGLAAGITTGTEATATLTAVIENYDGTVSIATKTVTVSKAALTPASLKAYLADGETEVTEAVTGIVTTNVIDAFYTENGAFYFEVLDQYGVAMKVDTFVVTNNTTGATVTMNNGVITFDKTPAADTSFNLTAITSNGLTKTVKVQF